MKNEKLITLQVVKVILYFSLFAFHFTLLSAQPHEIDSLLTLLKTDKEDTNKVKHFNALAFAFYHINPDTTILLAQQADSLAKNLLWAKGEANAYRDAGLGYRVKGDYPKALDYYLKALKIAEETGDKPLQAKTLGSIGIAYRSIGDYTKALDYDLNTLKIDKEIGAKSGIAYDLSNIGIIYCDQGDYSKALDYIMKALKMEEEIGDKNGMALDLGNIGSAYQGLGAHPKALDSYFKALKMTEEIGDKSGMAADLGSIGTLYCKIGKFKKAEEYLEKAITIDSSIGEKNFLKEFEESFSQLYDTTGRYKLALEWYKKAMVLKDTLFNVDKNKALTRKEMTYEFEKKEAAQKAEQDKKDAVAEADKRKQKIITWSVLSGLFLVLVFAAFIFRSLSITRKQKQLIEIKNKETETQKTLIEQQKALVEEKNKDITDSIHYASRIQRAMLTTDGYISKYLKEYFILFKPRDIVSGDFYWAIEAPGWEGAGRFLICAGD